MTIIKTTKELGTEMLKARKILGLTQSLWLSFLSCSSS